MTAAAVERILAREGLAPLDIPGEHRIDSRGKGDDSRPERRFGRAMAAEEIRQREVIAKDSYPRRDRRVVSMWARGRSIRVIARRTGLGRGVVYRIIARIKKARRTAPAQSLGTILADCEPTTIVLFFALLERALAQPAEVRAIIDKARAVPEIRAVLEPDEVGHGI